MSCCLRGDLGRMNTLVHLARPGNWQSSHQHRERDHALGLERPIESVCLGLPVNSEKSRTATAKKIKMWWRFAAPSWNTVLIALRLGAGMLPLWPLSLSPILACPKVFSHLIPICPCRSPGAHSGGGQTPICLHRGHFRSICIFVWGASVWNKCLCVVQRGHHVLCSPRGLSGVNSSCWYASWEIMGKAHTQS